MTASVAVAVVSHEQRDLLAATLRSLAPEQQAGRAEVWVVDNASADGSPELVRERFPWVSLIPLDENVGYGRAVNMVAERSEGEWIAPANNDIELRTGALERLIATGTAHSSAGAVAPRLVLPDGSVQHSVLPFPTLGVTLAHNSGVARLVPRLGDRLCLPGRWDPYRRREVPWAIATFMLVRRAAWDEVGGFSPEQWLHAEDLDLGWRLHRAGWSSVYEPEAEVFHVGSAATRRAFGDELGGRVMATSYAWMARRRGLARTRAVALLNSAGAAARMGWHGALAALGRKGSAERRELYRGWLAAHRAGLVSRDELLAHR